MRVLIFGGRKFNEPIDMHEAIADFEKRVGKITCIIHGDASGADSWGKHFAIEVLHIPHRPFPAKWGDIHVPGAVIKYTRGGGGRPYNSLAGFWRNQEMIDEGKPDWGMGFPGGAGTADMAARLKRARIPIYNAGYKP